MQKLIHFLVRGLALCMLVLGSAKATLAADGKSYVMGVIPVLPAVTLHKQWTPFVERLERETGIRLHLKLYERMAEFERDIWQGGPDFVFASPIQMMVVHRSAGYMPLLRGGKMVAIGLYTRRGSSIRSIADLEGKKIAFVGNKNLCSVAVKHLLAQDKYKLSYDTEYAGSTRNVIINVLLGKSDAGAVFVTELPEETEALRAQLRELALTPGIAPHPLAAHPRVPRPDQDAVKHATLAIATDAEGAELLRTLRLAVPIAADYDRDYRSLEEIDVKGLTNWGN